jgi:hypothetical protein
MATVPIAHPKQRTKRVTATPSDDVADSRKALLRGQISHDETRWASAAGQECGRRFTRIAVEQSVLACHDTANFWQEETPTDPPVPR